MWICYVSMILLFKTKIWSMKIMKNKKRIKDDTENVIYSEVNFKCFKKIYLTDHFFFEDFNFFLKFREKSGFLKDHC